MSRPSLRRALRRAAVASIAAATAVTSLSPASAQSAFVLSTPYPDVTVEAGTSVTFPLDIRTDGPGRVSLEVTRIPRGWTATLRGGGFVVDSVFADPDDPPTVDLEVDVPAAATKGVHTVVVTAASKGLTSRLPVRLRIAEEVAGAVSLEADFPQLQGAADATFTFDVTLENDTPRELRFALDATGPEGWTVTARPGGESQAATATVEGGGSTRVTVEADPPDDAEAGRYPIRLTASAGAQTVSTDLEAEITGSFAMTLTTPDERLNAEVTAGTSTAVQLVIRNDGSSPLADVALESTPPADWEVTFEPERVAAIPPGESAQVTARITPSGDAVAGDYLVNLSATASEASDEIELRTTVEASAAWGAMGIGLILAALAGLGVVFRRYGRR